MRHKAKPKTGKKPRHDNDNVVVVRSPREEPVFDHNGNQVGTITRDPWENWANR